MAVESYTNAAATTLSAAITTTNGTSISVTSATGFPSSGQYRILIDAEILIVTGGQGTTTWTVTRGAESTTGATHLISAPVTHILTAASLAQVVEGRAVVATADASYDFSAASGLWVPKGAGLTPASEAEFVYDQTARMYKGRDAIFGSAVFSRTLSAAHPASALNAATGTTEQAFAGGVTLPANFLIAGKTLRVTAIYSLLTTTTIPTSKAGLRWAASGGGVTGTLIFATQALAPAQGTGVTTQFGFQWLIQGTAAPGATANIECGWLQGYLGGSLWSWGVTAQPVAVATNAIAVIQPTWTFSSTGASNTVTLRQFLVEEVA